MNNKQMQGVVSNDDKPQASGLYLRVYHGRDNPAEDMQDWGYEGPMLGPLKYVHTTYAGTVQIEFEAIEHARRFGYDDTHLHLEVSEDMLFLGGKYYGDWTAAVYGAVAQGT